MVKGKIYKAITFLQHFCKLQLLCFQPQCEQHTTTDNNNFLSDLKRLIPLFDFENGKKTVFLKLNIFLNYYFQFECD